MTEQLGCQSCGMPLANGFFGTNKDSIDNQEYRKFYFQSSYFTKLDMRLDEMIQRSIDFMVSEVRMPEEMVLSNSDSFPQAMA